VAQADGKGVPVVQPAPAERSARRGKGAPPNRLREAVVTALYTIQPYQRTPEEVAAALLRETDRPAAAARPRPVGKELRATLEGKAVALARLAARARRRDGPQIVDRVALTDGAHALQDQIRAAMPDYTLVLDSIHAVECLWKAANALLGERHPERTTWVREHLLALRRGQVDAVVTALTAAEPTLATTRPDAVAASIGYYQRDAPFMRYDQYLARGWPIGTGVVESACGHLVKDRMQQAGMRWTTVGAHAILDLRAIRLTDDGMPTGPSTASTNIAASMPPRLPPRPLQTLSSSHPPLPHDHPDTPHRFWSHSNEMAVDAVILNVQIIGEAARHIPDDVQARYPDVDWVGMRGMRNVLVHQYGSMRLDVVWGIVQQELPTALPRLRSILEREMPDGPDPLT
jgi:uncharacterized protein with HEPN domain